MNNVVKKITNTKPTNLETKKPNIKDLTQNIETKENIPDDVIAHVKENLTLATNISSICVDGGYTKTEASGELARPGADLGISLSLISLGLTPKQAFLAVYDYRVNNGQKYGWHSDNHEGHANCKVGCGHCNAAITKNSHYEGVSETDVEKLLAIVKQHQKSNPENMRFIKLNRDHAEQGILIINNEDITVYPWDQKNGKDRQFFIYDATRDEELLKKIVDYVNDYNPEDNREETPTINYKDLKKIVDKHTNATLGLLGSSKGKPMYTISVKNNKLIIEKMGKAPIIDEEEDTFI